MYCYKTLPFRDGTSFKRSKKPVIGVLKAESTENDITPHFGCSRQTILMNRYSSTGSVKVRASSGRARVTTLRAYRVNTFTHRRNPFKWQPLLLVFKDFMHKR